MPPVFNPTDLPDGRALVIMDVNAADSAVIQVGPDPREIELLGQVFARRVAQGQVDLAGRILTARWVESRGVLNIATSRGPAYSVAIEVGHDPGEFAMLRQALADV
jgi:hypothetical protein